MSIRKTFFTLAIVSTFTITFTFAQTTTAKRETQSQAKPAASPATPTDSRGRRVGPAMETTGTQRETTKADTAASNAAEPSPANSPAPTQSPSAAQDSPNTKPAEKTPATSATTETEAGAQATSDPITKLREQIDVAPTPQDRIRLQLKLADELAGNGKKTEALAELQAITALDVFDPPSFYNAGNAFARLGATDEAVSAYRKAIEQRKGRYSRAANNLGVVLMRTGRWDEAADAFLSALRVENFRYAEASYNLGRLYATTGQMDLAVREWRRAVAVDPQHAAAAQSLARSGDEGRITVGQVPPVSAVVRNTRPTTVAGERQPPKPSSTSSAKPLTLDPTSFGYLQSARAASERGNKTQAIDNYRRVIARENGYFGPANLELSFVLIGLKRNDEAMAALREVVNREGSKYPVGYYHLARIYEVKGELKLAEEAFAQAVAAYGTKNNQFLLDLSRVREKQGNFKGALEAMEQYITLVKKDGQDIAWSEERLIALRQKASTPK